MTTLPTNNWNSPKNVNSGETQEKPFSHRHRLLPTTHYHPSLARKVRQRGVSATQPTIPLVFRVRQRGHFLQTPCSKHEMEGELTPTPLPHSKRKMEGARVLSTHNPLHRSKSEMVGMSSSNPPTSPSLARNARQTSGKGLLYLGYTWVDLVLSRLSKLSRASQDASKAVKAI